MGRPEHVEKTIRKIMAMVEDFTLDELRDLRFDLEELMEQLKPVGADKASAASAGEIHKIVREEWKKCGKPGCQCATENKLHGPYLYEYWKQGGRTYSRYLGKKKY